MTQGLSGLVGSLALVVGTVLVLRGRRSEGRLLLLLASGVTLLVGYFVGLVFLLYSLLVYRMAEGTHE
jgi:hypothetical protein